MFTPIAVAAPIYLEQGFDNAPDIVLAAPESLPVQSTGASSTYVQSEAIKHGVEPNLALFIWEREGGGDLRAIGDMNLTCKKGVNAGKPVRARGGWQITECYYPDVTDHCAFDLKCSTAIALPLLKDKKTCMSQFSTCRDYYTVVHRD